MNAVKVVEVVVDKFASKKFGVIALADTLIMILTLGRGETVIVFGILAICLLTSIGVIAIAKWSDPTITINKNGD